MKTTKLKLKAGLLATAAGTAMVINGPAQSVDALLDKLVDKGILSVKEGQALREESDKDFTKAYATKSGMPEWVSALKFNGDVRGRFEGFYSENPAFVNRDRFRYRLRFGVTLERPRRVFFVTMFPPILLVMMCCWFIFFLRPVHVEARVGTVITALLTTVFLQLAFTDDLPYLGNTVLLDQVFNFSYAVITAVLVLLPI